MAFAGRGETHRLIERYEEALKDFDRTIELDNDYAWTIRQRGQIHQFLGRFEASLFEASLQDFDRSIELDPEDNDWERYLRDLTLTKLDRPTEAQADLQTVCSLLAQRASPFPK